MNHDKDQGKSIVRHWLSILTITSLALFPQTAQALPDDKDQPIQLAANSAEMDDKKGISVYIGKVFLKQGSLEIEADKITIYSDEQGVKEIVAIGGPVKFRQQPKEKDPITKGFASKVEYHADTDQAIFTTNAKLVQGGDVITGDQIKFDIEKDVATASSQGKNKQVEMVIQPRKNKKTAKQ
ncbi:lipopolysaccharide transport periplasmic protein LptA [Motiliproteus sp. MSK22-1]|uniref:lipopolysaccharide transport periplasmic protein LptA n=1 Tax=Motiliproteus sp. MSK22-1 TaxID=1897630 RepID=UPI00097874A7|nr:lipopolysaccharide transport periplasmic protein LptA [Motiliproteus sp. MSK22-1]OMH30363.1 lipopolysaccharide transport periplasmic protein LptA [Motiliproteus sp. MSK22-1]